MILRGMFADSVLNRVVTDRDGCTDIKGQAFFSGNPAIVELSSVDRWLCVPGFHRVYLYSESEICSNSLSKTSKSVFAEYCDTTNPDILCNKSRSGGAHTREQVIMSVLDDTRRMHAFTLRKILLRINSAFRRRNQAGYNPASGPLNADNIDDIDSEALHRVRLRRGDPLPRPVPVSRGGNPVCWVSVFFR